MKKLALVLVCASLTGCGDSDIDSVKETVIKGYDGYTYGKVLDNHKVCEDSEWKSYKEGDVKKVSYTCSLKKGKVAFSFNEKEAEKIRKDRIAKFTDEYKRNISDKIKSYEENNQLRSEEIKKLKTVYNSANYYEYFLENHRHEGWDLGLAVGDALTKAAPYRSPITVRAIELFPEDIYSSSIDGRQLISVYLKTYKGNLSKEQKELFITITNEARQYVQPYINSNVDAQKKVIAKNNEQITSLKESLNNKSAIKEMAEKEGERAVVNYSATHTYSGKEIIIWSWNPVVERYDLERQYMRQHEYKDNYSDFRLRTESIVYSAIKNISDVDEYIIRGLEISAYDVQEMIQNN